MKDQYVGDYNDFVKYALLRAILDRGLPLLVCWMLTPNDQSAEGGKLNYLEKPEEFQGLDPVAFRVMAELKKADRRSVAAVEASDVLAGAMFFSRQLEDHSSARTVFFRDLLYQPPAVLFFDPDNGFEIPTKPRGHRNSSKYMYWSEVEEAFSRGHSVIVFQHFAREERTGHVNRLLLKLGDVTDSQVFALRSANVAFFCAPHADHQEPLRETARSLAERWGSRLDLVEPAQADLSSTRRRAGSYESLPSHQTPGEWQEPHR